MSKHQQQSAKPSAGDKPATGFFAEIRALNGKFCADLPQGVAAAGHYTAVAGDRFTEERFTAPNGLYRVEGSSWLLQITKGRFVEASRAVPPHFGGDDVIGVPSQS